MGAVVGILYAAGFEPLEIQEILIRESFSKVTGFSWRRTGLLKMEKLKGVLEKYIPKDDFSELKKPFYLGLSNLNEARQEIRSSGPIYDYLIASCSVPGFFAPVIIEENYFVDGGLMCNLPAGAIREKCRYLIGSHVNFSGKKPAFTGPKGIMERAVNLGINQNSKPQMKICDFMLDPPKMQNYSLFEFSKIEEIIEVGYTHTMEEIEAGKIPVKKLVKK
jgi:NTE family protein